MIKMIKKLGPFKWSVLAIIGLTIAAVLLELNLPNLMSKIIDSGIVNRDSGYILATGGIMLVIALGSMLCHLVSGYLSARTSAGLGRNLRHEMFTKVENFSMQEFDQIGTSSLITRTTNDITQIQNVIMMLLRIVLMAPIMMVGGIVMAVSKNAGLSAMVLISIVILVTVVVLVARKALPLSKSMQKKIDAVNRVFREQLTGIRVIRAFDTDEYEKQRFDGVNSDLTATARRMQRTITVMMPAVMAILNFTTVALVWFGAQRVAINTLMVGDLIAVIQYVMQIMMSVMMISMTFIMLPRASASAERINEVLEMQSTVTDPESPVQRSPEHGSVEFRDVSFCYPGAEEAALEHISFRSGPGETTAIIGSTGSGKSTLINLIPRLYDASEGEVLVDGVNVKEYLQAQLREKIGLVPQKAVLFSGTISENLRYGREDASLEEIRKAAAIAQSTEFIENKEEQYETHIAQGGSNVSGGQKQRLAIARAIVRKPEIYIFDDSFSALDFKTDSQLRAALAKETQNATVIIVAQRVSTIMNATRILVLDEGRMVGIGTHRELLETCDVYKEIVLSQLSQEEANR